ncbi:MAG: RIP metalloprotease RseP [Gammaproteobacteria bacterium]|nr:MAG: RIP metalloprotease RseP [Gammaproteobacteria bacterium]
MSHFLFTVLAFLFALGILVTVHEFGHFWVARRLGVKILRFSVGFGQPLWRWKPRRSETEYVVATIPLGGYVKMLDEREGPVDPAERDRAFNRKPVGTRIAVVAAGPLANLLFAVFAYWLMYLHGVPGLRPLIDAPPPHSPAAEAGLLEQDEILAVDGKETPTWDAALMALLDAALDKREIALRVRGQDGTVRQVFLDLSGIPGILDRGNLLDAIGLKTWRPKLAPVIDRVVPGGPADRAGLRPGDRIRRADDLPILTWDDWVDYVQGHPEQVIRVTLERHGEEVVLSLVPEAVDMDGRTIGRIGAYVRVPEGLEASLHRIVRYGPLEAVPVSLRKTWEMSALTLRTLWKMLVGEASVENLSGPISIAQYAGLTASLGLAAFLGYLAIVSISLGLLNLMPIPILDGGHLMYYLIELVRGRPVPERVEIIGQRIGLMILLALMSLALLNDFSRLFH